MCSGGTDTAYTTIAGGLSVTSGGQVLVVRGPVGAFDGIYHEAININLGVSVPSGSAGSPTTIRNMNNEKPWIKPLLGNSTNQAYGNNIPNPKSFITIDGLNCDDADNLVLDGMGYTTIPAICWNFSGSAVGGTPWSDHIVLQNAEVKNAADGFGFDCESCTFRNLKMHDFVDGPPPYCCGRSGYAFYYCGSGGLFENIEIYNFEVIAFTNYINDVNSTASTCGNNVYKNNYIHDGRGQAFGVCCANGNVYYNNVVANLTTTRNAEVSQGFDLKHGANIYNNTFYNISIGVLNHGSGNGLARNNIFYSVTNPIINTEGGTFTCITDNLGVNGSCADTQVNPQFVGPVSANSPATGWRICVSAGNPTGCAAASLAKDIASNLAGSCGPTPDCSFDFAGTARAIPWDAGAFDAGGTVVPPPDTPPVEDFVYTTGASLGGQNCTSGTPSCNYWTGPWTLDYGTVTTDAMTNSLTTGNAAHSAGTTAASVWRNFALTSTTGPIAANGNRLSWQARWDSSFAGGVYLNNNANNSVNVINVFGAAGGAIHVCEGASVFTLHTATAGTSYFYEVELDAAGHAGQFRIRVTPFGGAVGTFTAWTGLCNVPASPGVNRIGIYDGATTAHDFYVDSIGATATQLAFTTEPPGTVNSGATFAANASTTYSNGATIVPARTDSITLSVCPPSSSSATLTAASGLTKAAVNGTASWSDLVLTASAGATGVTICAAASMLSGGESTTITVNANIIPPITAVSPARMRARVR